jgi:prefoldin subunit 5
MLFNNRTDETVELIRQLNQLTSQILDLRRDVADIKSGQKEMSTRTTRIETRLCSYMEDQGVRPKSKGQYR